MHGHPLSDLCFQANFLNVLNLGFRVQSLFDLILHSIILPIVNKNNAIKSVSSLKSNEINLHSFRLTRLSNRTEIDENSSMTKLNLTIHLSEFIFYFHSLGYWNLNHRKDFAMIDRIFRKNVSIKWMNWALKEILVRTLEFKSNASIWLGIHSSE